MAKSAEQSRNKGKGKGSKKGKASKKDAPEVQPTKPNSNWNSRTEVSQCLQCGLCERLDETNEWFIQCDDCDGYFHFSCVGIIFIGEKDPWSCIECHKKKANPRVAIDGSVEIHQQVMVNTVNESVNKGWSNPSQIDLRSTPSPHPTPEINQFIAVADVHAAQPFLEVVVEHQPANQRTSSATQNRFPGTEEIETGTRDNSNAQRITSTRIQSSKSTNQSVKSHHHSVRSKSSTHRSVSSSQSKREAEIGHAEELFELQTQFDTDILNLKLEAVKRKAMREQLFLEAKYKAADSCAGSISSKSTSRSSYVSNWVDDQLIRTKAQSLIENIEKFKGDVNKASLQESDLFEYSKEKPTRSKSLGGNIQRDNIIFDKIDIDASIPLENRERQGILRQRITEVFGDVLKPIAEKKDDTEVHKSDPIYPPVRKISTLDSAEKIQEIPRESNLPVNRSEASRLPVLPRTKWLEYGSSESQVRRPEVSKGQQNCFPKENRNQFGKNSSDSQIRQTETSQSQRNFIPNMISKQFGQLSSGEQRQQPENRQENQAQPKLDQNQFGLRSNGEQSHQYGFSQNPLLLEPNMNQQYRSEQQSYHQNTRSNQPQTENYSNNTFTMSQIGSNQFGQQQSINSTSKNQQFPYDYTQNVNSNQNLFMSQPSSRSTVFSQQDQQSYATFHQENFNPTLLYTNSHQPIVTSRIHQSNVYSSAPNTSQYPSFSQSYQSMPPPNSGTFRTTFDRVAYNQMLNSSIANSSRSQQPGMNQHTSLTQNQIASRHSVKGKLPTFSGSPARWPHFLKRFLNSTGMCGYSDDENLERLDECLQGKAREIVESLLMIPGCVPDILEMLEDKYGRPELIVKAALSDIRSVTPIKPDKLEALSDFGYKVKNFCNTIESIGMQYHLFNPELMQELVDKLPPQTKIEWVRYSDTMQGASLKVLSDWLYSLSRSINRITTLEVPSYSNDKKQDRTSESSKKGRVNFHDSNKSSGIDNVPQCLVCNKDCKVIERCATFKGLTVDERWKKLIEQRLCRKCLKSHGRKGCMVSKECGVNGCIYKHHSLLHNDQRYSKENSNSPTSQANNKVAKVQGNKESTVAKKSGSVNMHIDVQAEMFRMVPVILHYNGQYVHTFAFLDEGSSFTLMERHIAKKLNLKGIPETICLLWTKKMHRQENSEMANLEISGMIEPSIRYPLRSVNIVEDLNLPEQSLPVDDFKERYAHLSDLPLIGYERATPTIMIGLKHARLATPLETIEGEENDPIATRSRLGWSVHGPLVNNSTGYVNIHSVKRCPCQDRDDDIHKMIKDHFTVENFGVVANSACLDSKENTKALKMLQEFTVKRENRFETRLLWKNDVYKLPDSYPMARKRLTCLENKGEKVIQTINSAIKDYLEKGYVSKLSKEEAAKEHSRIWYLPLFTVTHPKKPEKLRTVFDAAARVKGISLNSVLHTGPDLLVSIVDVLRRFRENRIAVCGDIKEMYHQVKVHGEDKHAQRFLWRNGDKSKEPDVYVMNVMTFGATCSPSAAQYVKNLNASQFQDEYPRAAEAIIKNHYVDDLMDGADNTSDAIQLIKDVKYVHSKGGFEIRNFKSNSVDVLKAVGEEVKDERISVNDDTNMERVLGMFWDTKLDCFTFSLKYTKITEDVLSGKRLPTKRELLKLLMSIFDPLGLLSHYLIHLKILLQDVWRSKIIWDDQLPENLVPKWQQWFEILPKVEELFIPRWYFANKSIAKDTKIELHVFVDAGEGAYAAVSYLRMNTDSDGYACSLIGAKARVTPLKYMSIPRKELMASLLGTRLSNSIQEGLSLKIERRIIWSDSSTVLIWLHSEHQKYSQFVAHRVGEILESTDVNEWRYVPTKLNVADEATKWSKTPTFNPTDRWFTGPEFLSKAEKEWPEQPKSIVPNSTAEEMKLSCSHSKMILPSIIDPANISKWQRAVRGVATALRWSRIVLSKVRKIATPKGQLSQEELGKSERLLFRQAQWEDFTDEMIILTKNQKDPNKQSFIEKSSSIYDCSPYLDEFGIMRQYSRNDNAITLTLDAKRPIILPRNHRITRLLMLSYHAKFFHRNHETVINELRQRFYIPRMRVAFRSARWNCKLCEIKRSRPRAPQMANLPAIRFEPGIRAFTYAGIDYFGPIKVKVGRSSVKRWGILFTCLTVRAIHIEIAESLSTESCIKNIRNFINLRGCPREFYSDNGTNLRGADEDLKNELTKLDEEKLGTEFTSCYTKWYFNPPAAPHMGGCWERLIRTVKTCMKESMTTRTPSEETLRSLLLEIMNVVNSRPLTYIPLDTDESEALTPNHFIMGSSNGLKPPGKFSNDGPYLRSSWREIQRCTDIFWKRFINEYVPTLTRRTKWFEKVKPIKVGDIVIDIDDNSPRNTYNRAKVVETKIASDNQVRRAKIQKADGKALWRPAIRLAVLDVNPAPTEPRGLDHHEDNKNRGENVGAGNLNNWSKTDNHPKNHQLVNLAMNHEQVSFEDEP